jgi:hypothetical protein
MSTPGYDGPEGTEWPRPPKPVERRPAGNVPRGLYRNSQGVELRVTGVAMRMNGYNTLSGDIALAKAEDELFQTYDEYLVTEASLKDAGYELIEPEAT